jgi:hypothetical protein
MLRQRGQCHPFIGTGLGIGPVYVRLHAPSRALQELTDARNAFLSIEHRGRRRVSTWFEAAPRPARLGTLGIDDCQRGARAERATRRTHLRRPRAAPRDGKRGQR